MAKAKANDYKSMTVDELEAEMGERNIEVQSGMHKADLIEALEADDEAKASGESAATAPTRGPRDDRKIVQGVQFPDADVGIKTYAGDDVRTLDELERRMTPAMYQRLKAAGAIEGHWVPTGKQAQPMAGSKFHREAGVRAQLGVDRKEADDAGTSQPGHERLMEVEARVRKETEKSSK